MNHRLVTMNWSASGSQIAGPIEKEIFCHTARRGDAVEHAATRASILDRMAEPEKFSESELKLDMLTDVGSIWMNVEKKEELWSRNASMAWSDYRLNAHAVLIATVFRPITASFAPNARSICSYFRCVVLEPCSHCAAIPEDPVLRLNNCVLSARSWSVDVTFRVQYQPAFQTRQ